MKPAKSRGHATARRFLTVFAVTTALFLVIARWWDLLGQPPWLMGVGIVVMLVAACAGLATAILYAAMFAAWRSERRS